MRCRPSSRRGFIGRVAGVAVLAAFALSCGKGQNSSGHESPNVSPQATQEPAPTVNPNPPLSPLAAADAGRAPPLSVRSDSPIPIDTVPREPRELVREAVTLRDARDGGPRDLRDGGSFSAKLSVREGRELAGYSLVAILHPADVPPPPKATEVSAPGLDAARKRSELRLRIDLTQTRMRIVFTPSGNAGFLLPAEAELRARPDHAGHLLLMPQSDRYRVLASGALRALLNERRMDVAPLSTAELSSSSGGPKRAGNPTRRVEVANRVAKTTIDVATLKEASEGGVLLCRALLDLMGAPATTAVCGTDDVPLHAEFHWATRGSLIFDVTQISRRTDFVVADFATPPASLGFTSEPLPWVASEQWIGRTELQALRTGPVDPGPPSDRERDAASAPAEGLVLQNRSDLYQYAWIDGVAVAWMAPGQSLSLLGLQRGRYLVGFRTFLADAPDSSALIGVPGRVDVE